MKYEARATGYTDEGVSIEYNYSFEADTREEAQEKLDNAINYYNIAAELNDVNEDGKYISIDV